MKAHEIINEDKLALHDMGFGLTQYAGKEYSLVGGSRSGSSPGGLTRLRYDIVDHSVYDSTGDLNKAKIGFVELFVKDGSNDIDGLVNIEIKNKKAGLGSKVVKDIVDTAGGELKIHDIQKSAEGFWKKMGAEKSNAPEYDAIIRS